MQEQKRQKKQKVYVTYVDQGYDGYSPPLRVFASQADAEADVKAYNEGHGPTPVFTKKFRVLEVE